MKFGKKNLIRIPALVFISTLLVVTAKSTILPEPPGGTGTVDDRTENAFQHPFEGVDRDQRREFYVGNSFFRDAWVAAPSSTRGRDGLGPTYNSISCSGCHTLDGRGAAFTAGGKVDLSLLFRLSQLGADGKFSPLPSYGDQFNPIAIDGVEPEGDVSVEFSYVKGTYPDGTGYELRVPKFTFSNLRFGPFGPNTRVSPRVAPHLAGLGLLEAVRESDVLALVDEKDANGDGISGRANYVFDRTLKQMRLGRFGWKSNQPSLRQQDAGAFVGDMGITSSVFPDQNCPAPQEKCKAAPSGGNGAEHELSDQILARVTTYTQLLAVPNRRISDPEKTAVGEAKFLEVGCAKCHNASFVTGDHEIPLLSKQKIFPYTDLLLHDLGRELADHRPDGLANGREWRTSPLWGIGLFPVTNKHSNLLHDGRARSIEEAILWHGGEAEGVKQAFMKLEKGEREAMLEFVRSL